MGGSYRQCLECGKRALSIATRCPGCGCEFPAQAVPERGVAREVSGFLTPKRVGAVLAVAAVVASATLGRTSQSAEEQAEVESSMATTAPLDTARVAAPPAEIVGQLLVARSWTNVRKSRSVSATLEAMLLPGDTVLADSLERGWYRVALEGEVLGYAHRSTLAALEPQRLDRRQASSAVAR
jgi:hypothetical protein